MRLRSIKTKTADGEIVCDPLYARRMLNVDRMLEVLHVGGSPHLFHATKGQKNRAEYEIIARIGCTCPPIRPGAHAPFENPSRQKAKLYRLLEAAQKVISGQFKFREKQWIEDESHADGGYISLLSLIPLPLIKSLEAAITDHRRTQAELTRGYNYHQMLELQWQAPTAESDAELIRNLSEDQAEPVIRPRAAPGPGSNRPDVPLPRSPSAGRSKAPR